MTRRNGFAGEGPRISVATIVRDDAEGLAETLASIAGVADEVVVLDTGSHDGTADVARRYGAKVFARPWDEDFAAARNACYAHTTGDWVLWLDSGERLSRGSAAAIRSLVAGPMSAAYRVRVRVPPLSADSQAEAIAPVRLVPRVDGLRFAGRIRESLATSLEDAGLAVEESPVIIERGPREHDADRKLAVARRNLRLAQRDLAERGNAPDALVAKGEACAALGRPAEAIDLLRLAIAAAPRGSATQLAAYGALLAALDKLSTAAGDTLPVKIALGLEALDVFPLDAQLLLAMGGYLQSQGQVELAARSFRVAWEHGTVTPDVWHVADARSLAASCLSLALSMLGRDGEALDLLRAALPAAEDAARLRRRMLEIHIRNGRRDEALAEVERVAAPGDVGGLRAAVRGACLAATGNWIGAIAQLEGAYRQGCRDAICRRAYLNALLATGQKSAALRIAEDWLADSPAHPEALRFRDAASGEFRADEGTASPSSEPAVLRGPSPRIRIDTASAPQGAAILQPALPEKSVTQTQADLAK